MKDWKEEARAIVESALCTFSYGPDGKLIDRQVVDIDVITVRIAAFGSAAYEQGVDAGIRLCQGEMPGALPRALKSAAKE